MEGAWLFLLVASIGGCIVGTRYVVDAPIRMCVEQASNQAERMECIKAAKP
jgi:hypothetical protein